MIKICSRQKLWQVSPTNKIGNTVNANQKYKHTFSSAKYWRIAWTWGLSWSKSMVFYGQRSKVQVGSKLILSEKKKKSRARRLQRLQRHSSRVRNADSHLSTVFLEMGAAPNSVNSSEACCMSQYAAKIPPMLFWKLSKSDPISENTYFYKWVPECARRFLVTLFVFSAKWLLERGQLRKT